MVKTNNRVMPTGWRLRFKSAANLINSISVNYCIFLIWCAIIGMPWEVNSQNNFLLPYHPQWHEPSKNALESMPCGGGDIGLNVWVENGDLLIYLAQSGTFDENNALLKLGRIRLKLSPNPFTQGDFKQTLNLNEGAVYIKAGNKAITSNIKIWVDVFNPVAQIEVISNIPQIAVAGYETWRFSDHTLRKRESNANSYKWAAPDTLKTYADTVKFENQGVMFYHQNRPHTIFDVTVTQQGLNDIKHELFNPLKTLIFGGFIAGNNMLPYDKTSGIHANTRYQSFNIKSTQPQKKHQITVVLHKSRTPKIENWQQQSMLIYQSALKHKKQNQHKTNLWWQSYWNRSFILVDPHQKLIDKTPWQIGRNYQLFRHQLACNAFGDYPTKFNGGLFTVDPVFTDTTLAFTPDFRNWGGGTFTAQNQRLVYWPMLKSGDFDLMTSQFNFYTQLQKNAELRSSFYWQHGGACFTEQMENFGLPNPSEYGWKRPAFFDKGVEYNAWLEYQWDTVLEFCQMMLDSHLYNDTDISSYIPFIESCLTFFDEHYQYRALHRGRRALDENGHLVLYPGSSCETYKMAYNATSTVAALKIVTQNLLQLPTPYLTAEKREHWQRFLSRIPPIEYREINGKTMISPAKLWERVNNTETPQLYPVYPWGIFGLGKPGLDTAINTYLHDPDAKKFRSHVGWKQDNIWAARLGLTNEAKLLIQQKLGNANRRYPTFWGPGFDWVPDHNWGGSGMIALQEMLMQTNGREILLFPAWPMEWDVHFKLHAPYQTTVEVILKDGKIEKLSVWPPEREKDIIPFQ